MGKVTTTSLKSKLKDPGRHGAGDGLYLVVTAPNVASWVVRVQKNKRRRDIGLGSAKKVSLAAARGLAAAVRSQVEAGLDPIAERRRALAIPTFEEAAIAFHAQQGREWRNAKHKEQWISSLRSYAFPSIGSLRIDGVNEARVHDLLAAIWLEKNETARRVRQRIATIIEWAVAKGFREAPLRLNVINRGLPKKASSVSHHAAMPYADLPAFMSLLRERQTWSRLALEALILTAARSGEIRGATWNELDFETGLWTIPASRMKARREHVVPLSPAAVAVFRRARELNSQRAQFVFEGMKPDRPMSDMTLTKALRDMKVGWTAHGFRSTFRDWVAEVTEFPGEIAEAALAHANPNKSEAAYQRGPLLEKRTRLMAAWSDYCAGDSANVVRLATSR